MTSDHPPNESVWRKRSFQVLTAFLVGLLAAWFVLPPLLMLIYVLRAVLLPVLIGLGLAYVVNPLIRLAHARWRLPRWAGASGVLVAGALAGAILLLIIVPPMVAQGGELVSKLKNVYPAQIAKLLDRAELLASTPSVTSEATGSARFSVRSPSPTPPTSGSEGTGTENGAVSAQPDQLHSIFQALAARLGDLNWSSVSGVVAQSLNIGVSVVGSAISLTTYLALSAVVILFCFFYFAWRFDHIAAWFIPFIPASRRRRTLHIIALMDRSVSAFVRGRLIQAGVMMLILSVGWLIVGVPYWLLLGVLSGLLNLVPFAAVFGWLVALALTLIDDTSGGTFSIWWTLVGPSVVYMIAQLMDGWLVEPIVQGKATDLDPLTVLLVVLIGGTLAGLLGVMIAIPTAACLKILAREVLLPHLRALAARN